MPAPAGAQAWKILYWSTVATGQPVPVSGIVVAPTGPATAAGRPVVAWAHATTGGPQQCAPSLVTNPAQELVDYFNYNSPYDIDVGVPALSKFLAAGDVVVGSDFQASALPGCTSTASLPRRGATSWTP
jgi:hypothetical protein